MFGRSRLHYALMHVHKNRKQNASSKLWIQNVLDTVKRSLECLTHMCSKCKSEIIQIHQLLVSVYFNLSNSINYDRENLSRTLKDCDELQRMLAYHSCNNSVEIFELNILLNTIKDYITLHSFSLNKS